MLSSTRVPSTPHALLVRITTGVIVGVCRSMIPDENESFEPDELIKEVNSHVYFLRRRWLSAPRKIETRERLEELLQFKAVRIRAHSLC